MTARWAGVARGTGRGAHDGLGAGAERVRRVVVVGSTDPEGRGPPLGGPPPVVGGSGGSAPDGRATKRF